MDGRNNARFDEVIERYYRRIYALVYRMVGDSEAAADLTQDTFVRAWQAWALFRGDSQVYTWLYRIAVNLTRNYFERRARERRTFAPELCSGEQPDEAQCPPEPPDDRFDPERWVENRQLGQLVAEAVLQLRPEQRVIIVLRDFEGLSYEEIAKILGCSVQAVKSRLFRARAALRKILRPALSDTPPGEKGGI